MSGSEISRPHHRRFHCLSFLPRSPHIWMCRSPRMIVQRARTVCRAVRARKNCRHPRRHLVSCPLGWKASMVIEHGCSLQLVARVLYLFVYQLRWNATTRSWWASTSSDASRVDISRIWVISEVFLAYIFDISARLYTTAYIGPWPWPLLKIIHLIIIFLYLSKKLQNIHLSQVLHKQERKSLDGMRLLPQPPYA